MFALVTRPTLLSHFTPRAEKHGAETKPAADLKFELNCAADVLDAFHGDLRWFLFYKVGGLDTDLANQVHVSPNRRFGERLLNPLKWGTKFAGYRLQIHIGATEQQDLYIEDCELNNLTFAPQEGGTVILGFRIQCHPDEREAGKLSQMIGTRVDISLTPPEGGGEVFDDEDEEP